jgi:hypothetical protein
VGAKEEGAEMKTNELEVVNSDSPAELIRQAVKGGADLEKLRGLLELQKEWEANEARKAYHKAMSDFKASPPRIEKDRSVSFGAGKASYQHASLANVVEKITAELSKHGLSASWKTHQNGQIVVTCRITHVLGHSEETTLSALADTSGSKNAIQAIGSTITYLQRYTILSALGLATEDQDDDGKASQDEVIDEAQIVALTDYINATDTDPKKFLKWLGVSSLNEIMKSQYQKALSALKAKEQKK